MKEKLFIRAPDSGSVATSKINFFDSESNKTPSLKESLLKNIRERSDFAVADIFPVHPKVWDFSRLFAVECKNYEHVDWGRILYVPYRISPKNKVVYHWDHLLKLCNSYKRVPMLVYNETSIRSQNKHPVILLPGDFLDFIEVQDTVSKYIVATFPQLEITVLRIHDFLRKIPFSYISENSPKIKSYLDQKVFRTIPRLGDQS